MLDDKKEFTVDLFKSILVEECEKIKDEIGQNLYSNGKFDLAVELFSNMITSSEFDEFLTLPAYQHI